MTVYGYGYARHVQRYEFLGATGYLEGKKVLEVGCGSGYGTAILSYYSKEIMGIDPYIAQYPTEHPYIIPTIAPPDRRAGLRSLSSLKWADIDPCKTHVDVVVAIEVFEHLKDPRKFLDFASTIGDNLFMTTPLAAVTGPTNNKDHVAEYNHDDLIALVSEYFEVLSSVYQTADMQMVDKAVPNGSSYNINHVVQMLWLKSKNKKGAN